MYSIEKEIRKAKAVYAEYNARLDREIQRNRTRPINEMDKKKLAFMQSVLGWRTPAGNLDFWFDEDTYSIIFSSHNNLEIVLNRDGWLKLSDAFNKRCPPVGAFIRA